MEFKCEIIERVAQKALCIRTTTSVGKLPEFLGQSYAKIMQYTAGKALQIVGPPYAAYYNTDMKNLEVEAGFPVVGTSEGEGDILSIDLPEGKVASCLFVGPYAEFEDAYEALNELIDNEKQEAIGTAFEFYLNDPTTTAPEDLQTQIIMPLK